MEADDVASAARSRLLEGGRVAQGLLARFWLDLLAVVGALGGVLAFHYSGGAAGARDAFVFMGFDLDRAYLLTAGIGGALAGAIAGLVGGRRLTWVFAGLLGLAALFQRTYVTESRRAMAGAGGIGQFDAYGWLVTTIALIACGMLLGLAAGILASQARAGLDIVAGGVVRAWRTRTPRALPLGGMIVTVLVVAALLIAVPVAGQLINYGPDSLMLAGGPGGIPITGEGGNLNPSLLPATSGSAAPSTSPGRGTGGGSVSGGSRPWLAWRPTGSGTIVQQTLPAPWTGGTSNLARFAIYLPPGYQSGARRYPVVYEIPWLITLYDSGADTRRMLDSLIDGGLMPPTIFVFLSSDGGPFVDNECIDAAAGNEAFDTFVGTTLVRYLDANFRTIALASARTLMGSSQGGFCAANVMLHHPDVFHNEISFSGYYYAAPLLHISPGAAAPYGGDFRLERSNSPMLIAASIPAALRKQLMFTLIGNPPQGFYGNQLNLMAGLARRLGYRVAQIDTPHGHSWLAVRATMPAALLAIGLRQAAQGVFAAP